MIRALVADDHPLLRSGVCHLLAQEADFATPGEASDGEELLRKIDQEPWDIVILDLAMPGRGGLDALPEILRRKPNLPVLVLSVYSEEPFAIRALRGGASGYISKADAPSELIRAIRRVLTGKKYVSQTLAEALANAVEPGSDRPLHEHLSHREFQIMCAIATGKTVSQIAQDISLSVKTISTYRARALEKMKMRTNSEFTRYALQNHLIT